MTVLTRYPIGLDLARRILRELNLAEWVHEAPLEKVEDWVAAQTVEFHQGDELDNLRAEVERLKDEALGNRGAYEQTAHENGILRRERDEAQAQVAVLCEAASGATCPHGMANEGDIQFWYERLTHALADIPAAARTLLTRLERAEQVAEALRELTFSTRSAVQLYGISPAWPIPGYHTVSCTHEEHPQCRRFTEAIKSADEALAAWQEARDAR